MISTPDGSGPVRPSMRIYRAENVKEPKKRRRVLRFFLWTFLVLGLVTATGRGRLLLLPPRRRRPDHRGEDARRGRERPAAWSIRASTPRRRREAARHLPADRPGPPARRGARPLRHVDAGAGRPEDEDRLDALVPARLDRQHPRPRPAGDHQLLHPRRPEADDRHDQVGHRHLAELLRQRRLRRVHADRERLQGRVHRRRPALLQPEPEHRGHELQLDRHRARLPADAGPGRARVRAPPPRRRRHVPARAPAAVPARVQGEARPDQHRPQPDDAARHREEEPQDHRQEADVARRHGAVRQHAAVDPEEQHGQRAVRRARAIRRSPAASRSTSPRSTRRSTSSSTPTRRRPTAPPTRPPARSRRRARSTTRRPSRSRCATATARWAPPPISSSSW